MRLFRRFFACVLASLVFLACATPAILLDHGPAPCGMYPVKCGPAAPTACCWEGDICTAHGCEFVGVPFAFDTNVEGRTRAIVREAFGDWSKATGVSFAEREPAKIRVHLSDRGPLAGKEIAGYESSGGVWLQERQTRRDVSSLRALAVHEIGHALGLPHSSNPKSCMTEDVNPGCADEGIPSCDVRTYLGH